MKKLISIFAITLFCITISSAQDMFLKFDDIDGESTDKDHKDWINLVSFSQAISRPASPAAGGATGATRRRGSVIMEDLTCSKELDKSSPKIAEAVCKGKVIPKVEIHMTRSLGTGAKTTYYIYELSNVTISSYQINAGDGDAPIEEFTLNFTEIKTVYSDFDAQGRKKGNIEYSWKVEEGR